MLYHILAMVFTCLTAPAVWALPPEKPLNEAVSASRDPSNPPTTPTVIGQIERLLRLQDDATSGQAQSIPLQQTLIRQISNDIRNGQYPLTGELIDAAAAYILSGGDPTILNVFEEERYTPNSDYDLLEGSALFMMGDREAAATHLKQIDLSSLSSTLRGRLALALAQIQDFSSPAHQYFLSVAISSMPGTLIEESALRRSTLAHADAGNEYMFWRRLERYQRRFSTSLFARQFYMELIHKFVSWSGHEQKPDLVKLGVFLSSLPKEVQPSAYRTLARAAARASQVEITDYAATRLQDISTADSADDHISRLYGSIFSIATKNGQMAFAQLQSINQTYLQPDDQALLVAALSIAKDINQPTKYSVIRNLPPSAPSPLEVDADKMLEDVGRLLQQAKS